jgi:hypothetical protein
LPIHEAIAIEESENEDSDSAQDSSGVLQGRASVTAFTGEGMAKYIGRREQLIGNSGPQNEAKNVIEDVDAFKMFFTQELIEIIIHEINIDAKQCIKSRGIMLALRSRMRGWKPVGKDEIYVILALFILVGIGEMPTLYSYFFKKILFWQLLYLAV